MNYTSHFPPGLPNLEHQSHGPPLFLALLHCVTCRYSGKNFCSCPHHLGCCQGVFMENPPLCAQVSSSLSKDAGLMGKAVPAGRFSLFPQHTLLQTLCGKCSFLRSIDFINNRVKERNTSHKYTGQIIPPLGNKQQLQRKK